LPLRGGFMNRGIIPGIFIAALILAVVAGAVAVVNQSPVQTPVVIPAAELVDNRVQDAAEEGAANPDTLTNSPTDNAEDATAVDVEESSGGIVSGNELNGSTSPAPSTPIVETPVASVATFNSPSVDYALDYCIRTEKATKYVKANMLPDEYIKASSDNHYLLLWKKLFLERNGIDELYFNAHVRIASHSVVEPTKEDEGYFSIKYYFFVDWFNLPLYDSFTIKQKDGKVLSDDEIIGLFSSTWGDPDVLSYYSSDQKHFLGIHTNVITFIPTISGAALEKIQSCSEMQEDIARKNSNLKVSDSDYHNMGFEIMAYVPAEYDSILNLVDPEQKCPFGTYDLVAEEFISYDADVGCGVP
jgi:hypothetical protein